MPRVAHARVGINHQKRVVVVEDGHEVALQPWEPVHCQRQGALAAVVRAHAGLAIGGIRGRN